MFLDLLRLGSEKGKLKTVNSKLAIIPIIGTVGTNEILKKGFLESIPENYLNICMLYTPDFSAVHFKFMKSQVSATTTAWWSALCMPLPPALTRALVIIWVQLAARLKRRHTVFSFAPVNSISLFFCSQNVLADVSVMLYLSAEKFYNLQFSGYYFSIPDAKSPICMHSSPRE